MANYLDETGLNQYTQALKNGNLKVGKAAEAEKVAAANIDGVIPISKIPQGALERLTKVADEAALLALTAEQVQLGDTVQLLDTKVMYVVVDESKLGTKDAFTEYVAGTATKAAEADHATNADSATNATNATNATKADEADAAPWAGITGKPEKFPSEDEAIDSDTIASIIAGTYSA